MREIIDIDQLTDWCVPVRVRGHLIETRNPLRHDMTLLDKRLKRSAYESDADLAKARKTLLDEMIEAIFVGVEWRTLQAKFTDGVEEPLSPFEKLSIVYQYSIVYLQATQGKEAALAFMQRGDFTLIEEVQRTQPPDAPATELPAGRIIGGNGQVRPISEAGIGAE